MKRSYEIAAELGFAPREIDFVEVPADTIYQMAAYNLPGRYAHWSFGRSYYFQRQGFEQGHGKIYELITNTHPSIGYLMDRNTLADQIFIITHCLGHADYFDRHAGMRNVRPDLLTMMQASRERFMEYEARYGKLAVEDILDTAHALSWHVDPLAGTTPNPERPSHKPAPYEDILDFADSQNVFTRRLKQDLDFVTRKAMYDQGTPCDDLLYFLITQAPLEDWERDILSVVREVGLALQQQMRTKMADEGWACFVGMKILHKLDVPDDAHWHQSALHAGVVHADPLNLNPYWLGWRLWTYLEDQGMDVKAICETENDVSLLRNYVDAGFVSREKLYEWYTELSTGDASTPHGALDFLVKTRGWEAVRDRLVSDAIIPIPHVRVSHVMSSNALELTSPVDLDKKDAVKILNGMARLWKHPVALTMKRERVGSEY